MSKFDWCLSQKDGISLVQPSKNLAEAYIKKAEEVLKSMNEVKSRDWKISTAYYTMYFSLYSILMRMGVKCEIHSCTIEFAKRFLRNHFKEHDLDFLEDSLKSRIDAQYYTNRNIPDEWYKQMIRKAPEFLVFCKSVVSGITEKDTLEIREKIQSLLRKDRLN